MKYFTKEFYKSEWLSYAYELVRQSKKAEFKDEAFYRAVYDKRYAKFENHEKASDWYHDFFKDLQKIDDYINEANITEEERGRREAFKKMHIALFGDRNRTVYRFDEDLCKRQFEERNNALIENYRQLPQEILSRIADIRVFALGYASAEVKSLLRPYCAQLKKTVKQTKRKAYKETDEAESYLTERIGLNEFEDFLLLGIEERRGDLYLKCGINHYLRIKGGRITEGDVSLVFPYYGNKPNCPWSKIAAAELHRTGNEFEISFLIENLDKLGKTDYWYLSIIGSDIKKINFD